MKKAILFLLCAMCTFSFVNAQEESEVKKKKGWIGGQFSFTVSGNDYSNHHSSGIEDKLNIAVSPELGLFVNDKVGIGFKFGFGMYETVANEYLEMTDWNQFNAGLFARCIAYKGKLGCVFVDGGFDYISMSPDVSECGDANVFSIGLTPGVLFDVSEAFSILFKFGFFGYQQMKYDGIKYYTGGIDCNLNKCSVGVIFKF
ncbi:opacity protein-like surface antigen [Dysgonomonadaceae bacterium PH5-43]|nr:opacity protein-like surface antigen [Dysgonomonadaceae bacterium PH5-43]